MPVVHVLDNPIWHALSGPQATVAEGDGRALRYDPTVSVFGAVPDDAGPEHWAALSHLVGPGGSTFLARDVIAAPPEWIVRFRAAGTQMTCAPFDATPEVGDAAAVEVLTPAAVPEMQELVERTQPGPFLGRTIELGTYLGIREHGTLVAMAGSRMHLPGYREISAVCTDDAVRGRGLAKLLVGVLMQEIFGRGETACLHAVSTNTPAIRLYESLGFTTRRALDFAWLAAQ
jgi:ribosomal protein S18 acetylase RimI-like enzyme